MRRYFEEGVKMVLDGVVNTGEMITNIMPLERVSEAFDLRNNKSSGCDAIHVLIDCEDGANDETTAETTKRHLEQIGPSVKRVRSERSEAHDHAGHKH